MRQLPRSEAMITRIMLIALVLVLTGCTHTRSTGFIGEGSYAEINRLGARKEATVTLAVERYIIGRQSMVTGQRHIKVSNLQMTPDSTSWLDPRTGRFETVATARIREVRIAKVRTNHPKGTLAGLGVGLLMGAVSGAIFGFAQGDDPPCQQAASGWNFSGLCGLFSRSAGEKAGIGALLGAVVGGALGALVGAVTGTEEIDRFEAPTMAPPVADGEHRRE